MTNQNHQRNRTTLAMLLAATAATGMQTAPADAQTPPLGDRAPRVDGDRIARQGDADDDYDTEAAFDWNGLRCTPMFDSEPSVTDDGTVHIDNLLKSTVAAATNELMADGIDWCLSVFVDNAGIIAFDDDIPQAALEHPGPHGSLDPAAMGLIQFNEGFRQSTGSTWQTYQQSGFFRRSGANGSKHGTLLRGWA